MTQNENFDNIFFENFENFVDDDDSIEFDLFANHLNERFDNFEQNCKNQQKF